MTQEEKDLLLQDICARVPFDTYVSAYVNDVMTDLFILRGITTNGVEVYTTEYRAVRSRYYPLERVKPYLRPISSMTEEEIEIFNSDFGGIDNGYNSIEVKRIDWLIKNHFDYRGLIPMGLALEALRWMYK